MKNLNIDDSILSSKKKKNTLFSKIDLRFWKNWNLLDGQRRGEVMFRRFFFLIAMGMLIYLLLLTLVGKKEERVEVDVEPTKTYAKEVEVIQDKEEWVDGDKVTTKADGTIEVVPAEVFMSAEELKQQDLNYQKARKIETYLKINRGNAPLAGYADKFVEVANKYNLDYRLLPAISVMESSGGKVLFRPYNAWGWGKKGFNSFEEGIETVGKGLSGYYARGKDTVEKIAPTYCPPNSTNWAKNVRQFMNEIESI